MPTPEESRPIELEAIAVPLASADTVQLVDQIRALRDADLRLTKRLEDLLSLSPNDLAALQYVAGSADTGTPVHAADLGALLHITSPSITLLVSRLIKTGHLTRTPDTRAILDAATAPTRDALSSILGTLSRGKRNAPPDSSPT